MADAGAQYLALVEPFNAETGVWNAAYAANDTAALRAAAAALAEAERTFADGLTSSEWPASVQETVDGLIGEAAGEIPVYLQIAASTDEDETWDLANFGFPERAGNAQKLRILLGLPNVPIPT